MFRRTSKRPEISGHLHVFPRTFRRKSQKIVIYTVVLKMMMMMIIMIIMMMMVMRMMKMTEIHPFLQLLASLKS